MAGERERGGGHRAAGKSVTASSSTSSSTSIVWRRSSGRQALRFCGAGCDRDQRAGSDSATARRAKSRGDPQGNRIGQAQPDGRRIARRSHAASRYRRPSWRGQGLSARGAGGYRHHRGRSDARGVRDPRHPGRVAKSIGSSNPYNMVRATFDALKHQEFAAFGCGAPQHQGVHAAVAPRRRRRRSVAE